MHTVNVRKSDYTVYIGRGRCPKTGKYIGLGNPFIVNKDGNRDQVIIKFKHYAVNNSDMLRKIKNLKETDILGCWCYPLDCHGDAIKEIWEDLRCDTITTTTTSDRKQDENGGLNK